MSDSGPSQEITIIEDDGGLLLVGDDAALLPWLEERGLSSRDVTKQTRRAIGAAGQGGQLAAEMMANSGRWVKLTEESAQYAAKYHAQAGVARDAAGRIVKHLNFEKASTLVSPAALGGIAGMMSQMALQQSIDQINDYLEVIDKKIDDLLQDQKDQTLADLFGICTQLDSAMAVREQVGFVSETTWSTIAGAGQDAARAQGYALLKLEGLAKKVREASSATALAGDSKIVQHDVAEWLAMLAGALRLYDQLSIIQLDRVMVENPEIVGQHRAALQSERAKRLHAIEAQLRRLGEELEQASVRARRKKALHPVDSDAAIGAIAGAAEQIELFADRIGVDAISPDLAGTQKWRVAVAELADDTANGAVDLGKQAAAGAADLGAKAADGAMDLGARAVGGAAEAGQAAVDQAKDALASLKDFRFKAPKFGRK